MTECKELISVESLTPANVFKAGGADPIIEKVKKWSDGLVPDVSTKKGRDEIKANAASVRRFKARLEDAKKGLKKQYKDLLDPIDAESRKFRESLDKISEDVRAPLTEYEEAEAKRKAAEALAAEQAEWDAAVIVDFERAFDEATAQDDLFNREREVKAKEAELARIEAERVAKEEAEEAARVAKEKAEQEAKAKAEHEAKLKEEAEAKAKREAEEAAQRAEQKRLADIQAAEAKAAQEAARIEREKQAEIDRLNRIERERLAEEGRKLAEQKLRDQDKEHRGEVNRAIVQRLVMVTGCDPEKAQAFVKEVVLGEVDNIKITY